MKNRCCQKEGVTLRHCYLIPVHTSYLGTWTSGAHWERWGNHGNLSHLLPSLGAWGSTKPWNLKPWRAQKLHTEEKFLQKSAMVGAALLRAGEFSYLLLHSITFYRFSSLKNTACVLRSLDHQIIISAWAHSMMFEVCVLLLCSCHQWCFFDLISTYMLYVV